MARVLLAALLGGLITGSLFATAWILLVNPLRWEVPDIVEVALLTGSTGAIVGAVAGATSEIVKAVKRRAQAPWD